MSTATYEVAASIPLRVGELDVLISHAEKCQDDNEALYNAICRATAVLLASHLEGFLKDLTRSLILDLNYYLKEFSSMPAAMQRTFCHKIAFYEGIPLPEIEKRIKQLMAFFSGNSVNIDMGAFAYKENPNKNPNADFIDKSLRDLGVPDVVSSLDKGQLEIVFNGEIRSNYKLVRDLLSFRSHLYDFPFRELPPPYSFNRARASEKKSKSLWYEFIQTVLERRHRVAHGDTLANEATWEELKSDSLKLKVLMYGVIYSSASFLTSP
jgi:hypothetical protein